ncbi:hypothetical protein ACFLXE_02640 [Chloroflexota bacterium]
MEICTTSIIDSYEARVKTVGDLMKQTIEALRSLDVEQEARVLQLRDLLARAESLRRTDFDTLTSEIWARRREKENRVARLLALFLDEQGDLAVWLREVVTCDGIDLEEFRWISQALLGRQKEMEGELGRLLRELHIEQEEMDAGLRRLLGKGDRVRVRDFKAMLRAVQLRQSGRQDEVGRILEELWGVDEELAAQWHKVMSVTGV